MCLYPKIILNKKYVENKKNGGVIPPCYDERVKYVPIGCGKCMECKKQKARNWQVRLHEELRENNENSYFVTWSFDNKNLNKLEKEVQKKHREVIKNLKKNGIYKESKKRNKDAYLKGYDLDNEVCRLAVRRYCERWRKKYKKTIRHWIVTEIGGKNTERVHMHGIVWCQEKEDIEKIWQYGKVYIGDYVNEKTINYIVKYINKVDENHKEYNSKIFTSQGIGANYLKRLDSKRNEYKGDKTDERYTTRNGIKLGLPIYYRNKLYNEEEREILWIKKLDKEERWVLGEKIDISNGDEDYRNMLEIARIKNKRLGYGDDEDNWDLKKYEQERRNLKRIERLRNTYE
jgi:hypothetical protein